MCLTNALQQPSCTTCKHFIPYQGNNIGLDTDLGLCKMFQDDINGKLVKNLAIHCRNNQNQCGKEGFLYEPILNNEMMNKYDELEKLTYSEFMDEMDLHELEEIEKHILETFQKMRKHNTKRLYKTTKDIYKLFKKSK
jgi:hypothetical protein